MATVTTQQARDNFAQLIELAFYKGENIRVKRNNKPMAWIVGDPLMNALNKVIDYIIEHEPTLADTLALTVDEEVRSVIEHGTDEVEARKTVPIEIILED